MPRIESPDDLPEPTDHDGLQARADSLNDAERESAADAARWEQIKRDFLANAAPVRCGIQLAEVSGAKSHPERPAHLRLQARGQ